MPERTQFTNLRPRGPLVGNFEENILNDRLEPLQTIEGYRAELRASGRFLAPTFKCQNVKMSILELGDSFPYFGQIKLSNSGYRIPRSGTLQVTLFDPLDTLVNLFVLSYDLRDMPADSQTFIRQRTIFAPTDVTSNGSNQNCSIHLCRTVLALRQEGQATSLATRCMIQLNVVSSKRGKIYLNRDLRLFISKKVDLETAAKHSGKQTYAFTSYNEMPENPRYFER